MRWPHYLLFFVALVPVTLGIKNGLALTPPMGYSSWFSCTSEVTEKHIKDITAKMISSGLAAKGYVYVNVDEGWFVTRDKNGRMLEDRNMFPSGMKALGEWIHDQDVPGKGKILKYGLYTGRGKCSCDTWDFVARCWDYNGNNRTDVHPCPGSKGHVFEDVEFMIDAGMDYLKVDSCCTEYFDQDLAKYDYGQYRDAIAKSGRPVVLSLCGWAYWYAYWGHEFGNLWRIGGDGDDWKALTAQINTMAQLSDNTGPDGWNDPDFLIANKQRLGGCTEQQTRTQFSLWCVFAAPLIMSTDLTRVSDHVIETYGNTEAIAVNQDPKGKGGMRLLGGDLTHTTGQNVWAKELHDGSWAIVFLNNEPDPSDMECDADCLRRMGFPSETRLIVRDLWEHQDIARIVAKDGLVVKKVPGEAGSRLLKITPHTVCASHPE